MKKRCYFIGAPAGPGSVAGHFLALGRELANRGHEVKLISPSSTSNEGQNSQNLAVFAWPSARPTRLADALFLVRLMRRYRPDCLIANFAAVNWMCLMGWLFGVKHRLAFYHTLSTQLGQDVSGTRHGLERLTWLRKRLVYKAATSIVANSQAALLDIQNAYGVPAEKCKLWRYSMADPAHRIRIQQPGEREDTVVCAGRLYPSKGQDVLLQALELGLGRTTATKVEFLGSGPMAAQLQELAARSGIANRCSFVGLVSNEEVLKRMSRAKITVVPSRNEAFGLVNIESMSVGTPVIASRVDGIPEIVRDGMDGYLVPPGDVGALAEKLALVLHDPGLRERLGENARQRFLSEYEDELVVQKQADSLDETLRHSENGSTNGV
jgi:glycosyltransferase involved in cell wall biosynthesis